MVSATEDRSCATSLWLPTTFKRVLEAPGNLHLPCWASNQSRSNQSHLQDFSASQVPLGARGLVSPHSPPHLLYSGSVSAPARTCFLRITAISLGRSQYTCQPSMLGYFSQKSITLFYLLTDSLSENAGVVSCQSPHLTLRAQAEKAGSSCEKERG